MKCSNQNACIARNVEELVEECGDFELKIPRMREFSSQICDNQPANLCNSLDLRNGAWL